MIKISNSKQIKALVRLLFHYLYLEFICFLGFVVCDFMETVMNNIEKSEKVYDLEERTFQFSKNVRLFIKIIPKTIANIEMKTQITNYKLQIKTNEQNFKFKTNQSIGSFVISLFVFGIYLLFGICFLEF